MATNVYESIREAIVKGRIKPGEQLSESNLATEYGTSRTPIREALQRLEVESLVERLPRGVQVRETSPEEIIDIYDVRITLEGAAARAAAERATELDRRRLRAAQSEMEAIGSDPHARAESNRHFHEAVWAASHSPTLIDMLHRLNVHLVRYPTTTLEYENRWQEVLEEHNVLLDAIDARDSLRAREIAEKHMSGAREVRMQMYAEGDA
ncbi:GntR family transcriptional regulator [Arthrobacter sp. YD2]|uniref:GntR family transcriptional regulator n=1 Tax=Arthrobacter sp. YD2 TaxID=3058046 RepID=UPI0025B3286C|nr:GntR family transcriptional regulator [Arthrobacter sp. YD2]MDN3903271.1 GntR family transcriptional regulator [Arthrobacter sp. YD2]